MPFLTKDDFGNLIRNNMLDAITNFDDTKLDTAILEAVDYMKGHLNSRYDVEAIFSATGNNRSPIIMMMCKDIVIYNIHSLANPRTVPLNRSDRYKIARQWLDDVKNKLINQPGLPEITVDSIRDDIKFGGNTKQNYHI